MVTKIAAKGARFVARGVKKSLKAQAVTFYFAEPFARENFELEPRMVTEEQAAEWQNSLSTFPWKISDARARMAAGHQLFALMKSKTPVAFAWRTVTDRFAVGELGSECLFPRKVSVLWDCVTPTEFRGQSFYPKLLRALIAQDPTIPSIIYVRKDNPASIRGIEKAGFTAWMTVRSWRFGRYLEIHSGAFGELRFK